MGERVTLIESAKHRAKIGLQPQKLSGGEHLAAHPMADMTAIEFQPPNRLLAQGAAALGAGLGDGLGVVVSDRGRGVGVHGFHSGAGGEFDELGWNLA